MKAVLGIIAGIILVASGLFVVVTVLLTGHYERAFGNVGVPGEMDFVSALGLIGMGALILKFQWDDYKNKGIDNDE